MTAQEQAFENKRDQLRHQAVDKEVQRLRNINRNQSAKITNLRKAIFFQVFFFVSLLGVFLLKGMINFSGNSSSDEVVLLTKKQKQLSEEQNSLSATIALYQDSLNKMVDNNITERSESGYKYRIQIGAFKEIDLSDYAQNFVAINQETYDSIFQYTLGMFSEYEKALHFLKDIKKMGFEDSFIIATKNGRRIRLEQLPKDIKAKNDLALRH